MGNAMTAQYKSAAGGMARELRRRASCTPGLIARAVRVAESRYCRPQHNAWSLPAGKDSMHTRRTLTLLTLLAAVPAAAQDTISAERPGFSSSPYALDEGRWQIEGGYRFTHARSSVDQHTLPLALLRYGAGPRAEIRFSWPGIAWTDGPAGSVHGPTDASIGVKWQLTDDAARTPVGVFAGLSLPVGDDAYSSDEVDPTLGLFWAHNGRIGLFGTALLSQSGSDTVFGNAVGVNLPLRGSRSAYVEYFGSWGENRGPEHTLDGGFIFLQSNDMQFDVHAGIGLNERAADGFLGIGAAWRFR